MGVIDFSTLGEGLLAFGVFMLNFLVYEFIVFGIWLVAIMPVLKSEKATTEEAAGNYMKVTFEVALLAMVFLVVAYASGLFRLITF